MDFAAIMRTAKNNAKKNAISYYSTKYEPPKKEQKKKHISANVQKLIDEQLAEKRKKEEMERQKQEEEKRQKAALLKFKKKTTANSEAAPQNDSKKELAKKSQDSTKTPDPRKPNENVSRNSKTEVLSGAIDIDTEYVSKESLEFYEKFMEKHRNEPKDITFTKKTKSSKSGSKSQKRDEKSQRSDEKKTSPESKKQEEIEPQKQKPSQTMNFEEIIKLAAQNHTKTSETQLIKEKERPLTAKQKLELERKKMTIPKVNSCGSKQNNAVSKPSNSDIKKQINDKHPVRKEISQPKHFPPADVKGIKPKKSTPDDVKEVKQKQFPPADVRGIKPKQFPPADVRRFKPKQFPPTDVRRNHKSNKRRVLDDYDSEYDSEMDDFIDDEKDAGEDVSSVIKQLFGYDKTKYRNDDFDDRIMESSYAQQMKEECVSKKIAIQEDLEDMKREEEHYRRKRRRLHK